MHGPNIHPVEQRRSIVVVADFAALRELVRLELESLGPFRVVGEANAAGPAIDAVAAHRPEFVLLDLELPRQDAWSALGHMREGSPASKIFLYTARSSDLTSRARRHGATGVIHKRVGGRALVRAMLRYGSDTRDTPLVNA
jgi:DNA-binding NarL/FixJ family response regulator